MDLKNESKLLRLRNTFDKNYKITRLYANYLEKAPTFISRDMIDELCSDGALDIKSAITALVCEIIGLDFENPVDRELMRDYVAPSVRILDSRRYTEDAYYKNVKIQNKTVGNWEFRREAYPAFRAPTSGCLPSLIRLRIVLTACFCGIPTELNLLRRRYMSLSITLFDNGWYI